MPIGLPDGLSAQAVNILHISDIHFEEERFKFPRKKLTKGFMKAIEMHLKESSIKPDLLFITGDVAYHGYENEYKLAEDFLEVLVCSIDNPSLRIFMVPGNHDVYQKYIDETKDTLQLKNPEDWNNLLELERDGKSNRIANRFPGYFWFLERIRENVNLPVQTPCDTKSYFYTSTFYHCDCTINVLGLNSAWACQGDYDRKKIALGEFQVQTACECIDEKNLHKDLSFALTHHPLIWLSRSDKVSIDLLAENKVLVFRGHRHIGRAYVRGEDGERIHEFGVSAGYLKNPKKEEIGFQFVTVDPLGGKYYIWPFIWKQNRFLIPSERSKQLSSNGFISDLFREPIPIHKRKEDYELGVSIKRSANVEWIEIIDPNGKQKELFEASKKVYRELFSIEHQENPENFRRYILDTQDALKIDPHSTPRDYYFVGLVDNLVQGMELITTYREKQFAFVSYIGFLNPKRRENFYLIVKALRKTVEIVSKEGIRWVLGEVEKIAPENLANRDKWTIDRAHVLRTLQKRGFRKVPWLIYRQPALEVDAHGEFDPQEEAKNLHLVTLFAGKVGRPSTVSRDQVLGFIDFVYNYFYLDGFVVSHPEHATKAEKYLRDLSRQVMDEIPSGLKTIPLCEVNLKPLEVRILIIYTPDSLTTVELIAEFLMDMGVHVIYWEKDKNHGLGKNRKEIVREWMDMCHIVIALFTQGFSTSSDEPGEMESELKVAMESHKRIIPLVRSDSKSEIIDLKVKYLLKGATSKEFDDSNFHEVVKSIEKIIVNEFSK